MTIERPCYANRGDVKRSLDLELTAVDDWRVDRAIQSAADETDAELHRYFYPWDKTVAEDWPNWQYAPPWTNYREEAGSRDIVVLTGVQSPPGTVIPLWQVFLYPNDPKRGWPWQEIQLDRSTTAAWGAASTPQRSILFAGTWGWYNPVSIGTLAASVNSSAGSITVSDGSQADAGDLLVLDPGTGAAPFPAYPLSAGALGAIQGERVIVTGKTAAATGLTQSGGGCSTASSSDNALGTTGTGSLNVGEVILLDTEQMLITDITNSVATVKRAWNGTALSAHSTAAVYAYRALSVLRGQLGTAAASHNSSAAVSIHRPPSLVRDLNIAAALDRVLQETSGYARTVGAGDAVMRATGASLSDLWDRARTAFGRKARVGAI